MKNRFINILAAGGTGATFLDWTIYYLSNSSLKKTYIDDMLQVHTISVVNNPIINNTSHLHKKTHFTCDDFGKIYSIYKTLDHCPPLFSTYIMEAESLHAVTMDSSPHNSEKYTELVTTFNDVLHLLYMHTATDVDILFNMQYSRIPNIWQNNKEIPLDESVWKRRELWALYYHRAILEQLHINETNKLKSYDNVYVLSFLDFIYNFDKIIYTFFDTMQIPIIDDRMQSWIYIYKLWQQQVNILFYKKLNYIIDCIIHNIAHDLSLYNISFSEEIVISKKLLFEHNLSLMTEGINIMPQNTKEWHLLLEENIYHNISSYEC